MRRQPAEQSIGVG